MHVAVLQTRPVFGDREGNLSRAIDMMESTKAELYVIPELFSTGYLFTSREELSSLAEPMDGPTIEGLKAFSRRKQCMIYGGIAESAGGKVYNSSALLVHGTLAATYRKLHLFKKEKDLFDRSLAPPRVVEVPGARMGLMICFDWIFPEMARSLALNGAQILLMAANLVLPWCQRAMVTRSLENGVFTVLANRIGEEDRGGARLCFTGGSEIINHRGEILARASEDREEILFAEIDPEAADDKMVTPENHLFEDRRPEHYSL